MILIFIGAPGAGKGTQAELLAKRKGFYTLSTGDALRKHVKMGTPVGLIAKEIMARGELVPDETLLQILKEELGTIKKDKVILDGYPRNLKQAETLGNEIFGHKIACALHLDIDEQLLVERLSGRLVCSNCGATYHMKQQPPGRPGVCDKCQGPVSQRADDTEESVRRRLEVYQQSTKPLLAYYQSKGMYRRVDGLGGIDEVFKRVENALDIP